MRDPLRLEELEPVFRILLPPWIVREGAEHRQLMTFAGEVFCKIGVVHTYAGELGGVVKGDKEDVHFKDAGGDMCSSAR